MNVSRSLMFVNRDLDMLAPLVKKRALLALSATNSAGYPVEIFEGFRTPQRQDSLYAQGRTQPGKIVSDEPAWRSWHQYGLALDVAYRVDGKWSWNGEFDKVSMHFVEYGFKWLSPYERVHFQITGGISIDDAYRITRTSGLQSLWNMVEEKVKNLSLS